MKENSQILYSRRQKENYFKHKKEKSPLIFEFFDKYLSFDSKEKFDFLLSSKNYINIYNALFLIDNKQDFIDIYLHINKTLLNIINEKLKSIEENKNNIDYIITVTNYFYTLEKKIKSIKNILTTCNSRFASDLVKSMNDNLNISSLFLHSNKDLIKFFEYSEKSFLEYLTKNKSECQKLYLSIFQFINIIKVIASSKEIDSFIEKIFNIIIEESNYNKIYEDYLNSLNKVISEDNNIQGDFINIYINSIYNEIEKSYIIFLKMFGEKEAKKLKEKIIKIYIFDKLISNIFNNEKLLRAILLEKKYDILKIIESKTRHSLKLTKEFVNHLFDIFLIDFQNKISFPSGEKDISKGINYIEKILLKISELNLIFKDIFNQNRKVQLKFHETILKLINIKKSETLEYFLSVYVNENLYKNNVRNNFIINKAFIQLLSNCNNKEIFFKYHNKYIIKRISNNIFNLDIESDFHNFLKKNIENKYMIQMNRIFKDIEDSKYINDVKNNNFFYLFSFNTLDEQYDLLQIIDLEKPNYDILNPFKSSMDTYNQIYPKRKIKLSHIFSTLEVLFLNKYNLVINYIQWYIIQIILNQKNDKYSITYEKLLSLIPFKIESKIYLKVYITSLIELNILIKQSKNIIDNEFNPDDILQINMNFNSNKKCILCFSKANNIVRGIIKKNNQAQLEESEIKEKNYNKNYKSNAIKDNAGRIIDCIIAKIIKVLPKEDKITEKDLIITLVKHKLIADLQLKKYNVVDTPFIKQRIDSLVDKEIIKRYIDKETNIISYSFY